MGAVLKRHTHTHKYRKASKELWCTEITTIRGKAKGNGRASNLALEVSKGFLKKKKKKKTQEKSGAGIRPGWAREITELQF